MASYAYALGGINAVHPGIRVTYDDRRHLYHIKGGGFDFWLYFTSSQDGKENFLECDDVRRYYQDGRSDHIIIDVKGRPSVDWVESQVIKALAEQTFLLDDDEEEGA